MKTHKGLLVGVGVTADAVCREIVGTSMDAEEVYESVG